MKERSSAGTASISSERNCGLGHISEGAAELETGFSGREDRRVDKEMAGTGAGHLCIRQGHAECSETQPCYDN